MAIHDYTKKYIEIITDGACKGNPGYGGWAAILKYNGKEKKIFGAIKEATNNQMELFAVIQGLKALKLGDDRSLYKIKIISDSKYIINAFNENWIEKWRKFNFMTSSGDYRANHLLWKVLYKLQEPLDIEWQWVKAHHQHRDNIRADKLANFAIYDMLFPNKEIEITAAMI
jgi:ribonuclease HI